MAVEQNDDSFSGNSFMFIVGLLRSCPPQCAEFLPNKRSSLKSINIVFPLLPPVCVDGSAMAFPIPSRPCWSPFTYKRHDFGQGRPEAPSPSLLPDPGVWFPEFYLVAPWENLEERETTLNYVRPLYKLCSVYLYCSVNKDSNWYNQFGKLLGALSSKVEAMPAYMTQRFVFRFVPCKNAHTCAQGDMCNDVWAVWFPVAPNWKGHRCFSALEMINSAKHIQWTTRQQREWTNYSYIEQHGRTLKTRCWVKEARCNKNMLTIHFQKVGRQAALSFKIYGCRTS